MKPSACSLVCGLAAIAGLAAPGAAAPLDHYIASAPFPMPAVTAPEFPARNFSITAYGAVADGRTLNTDAFARAIAACVAAGGGHVVVPPGLWLTGPIVLQSHVDLHAERGALVQFTGDHRAYPMVSRRGRGWVTEAPLSATGQTGVAITGAGIFDGAGDTWRPVKKEKTTEAQWRGLLASGGVTNQQGTIWWPTPAARDGEEYLTTLRQTNRHPTAEEMLPARDFRRPPLVSFIDCENVLVEGVTLRNSASGVFAPSGCTNVIIRDATIFNEWWAQNGDGMDIGPCRNVLVYRCTVSAGDDGICMKSGGASPWPGEPGLQRVIVAECTVYHGHGGFVVGGSTEGGMHDLWATQCVFVGTDTGIRVKSGIGHGALVDQVYVDHIVMRDIVNEAILFDTHYDNAPASAAAVRAAPDRDARKTPEFRDFFLRDLVCLGAGTAISITGLPQQPVHAITLERAILTARRGVHATDAADILLRAVQLHVAETPPVVEHDTRNIRFAD